MANTEISIIVMNKQIEYFGDSALNGELNAVILRVVWFNGVFLESHKSRWCPEKTLVGFVEFKRISCSFVYVSGTQDYPVGLLRSPPYILLKETSSRGRDIIALCFW